jgi:hypothetical protein
MKTGSRRARLRASQASQPTCAFDEKSASILLTVIKRRHGFAALDRLTDGD